MKTAKEHADYYAGKSPSEELRDIVANMVGASDNTLCTVRTGTVRHAAIMLDKETGDASGQA